jgi:hypothetical protein
MPLIERTPIQWGKEVMGARRNTAPRTMDERPLFNRAPRAAKLTRDPMVSVLPLNHARETSLPHASHRPNGVLPPLGAQDEE